MTTKPVLFDIQEVEWKDFGNGLNACVLQGTPNATIQYWEIQPGGGALEHSHPEEQIVYIQSGRIDLTVDGVTYDMGPGCFCVIPPNASHATYNKGKDVAINIDVFLPARSDRIHSKKDMDLGHTNW